MAFRDKVTDKYMWHEGRSKYIHVTKYMEALYIQETLGLLYVWEGHICMVNVVL